MALRLEIDNGDLLGRVDYTRYLASPDRSPAVLRDRMNLPALVDFSLVPADNRFLPLRRSAYVRLTGLAEVLPPGGPRVPGPIFTGYITNEPVIEFLGVLNGSAVHGYRYQATSEEYLLNVKRFGLLPPFLNQTAGAILRSLVERLQPGRFDTSGVADGAFIPFYAVDPERMWSEVARDLAERSGFYYRVLDSKIVFQPVNDLPFGVIVDERDRRFRPGALEVTPLGNPIQNDVTVFGRAEPQAYVREYFVGDGFTSRFPLSAPVYRAQSARLLADDFTSSAIDTARWQELDPAEQITLFEGRLNMTGGTGNLGETAVLARQPVELGGELEFIHGEFEFIAASRGILGGLYSSTALSQADCLVGFEASPISGTTRVRALIGGAVQAAEVIVLANHHYVLVTRLSADRPHRVLQMFPSAGASYGGEEVPARVKVTLEVRDLDLADPAALVSTILYENTLDTLPVFAFYAPVNSADLHVVANFLQVTQPMQAELVTQKPGEEPRTRTLGFGIAGQDATITEDPNRNQWALEFYEDTIPAAGERMALRYRAAGRARARIRDASSIASEASLAGDDGVRAVVLDDVNPAPRTSAEADLAAQAYLADHVTPRYEGRYTTWGEFADSFPRSGRLLEVRNESRYPAFQAIVRQVTSELRELASERILHTIEFGQPALFEDFLRQIAPVEGILQPDELLFLAPLEAVEPAAVYLEEAAGLELSSVLPMHFAVDLGAPPPDGGHYEVRRNDQGWGAAGVAGTLQNRVGVFTSQVFLLPRTARKQAYFVRPVGPDGLTSRFSSALVVHYPLVPPQPLSLRVAFGTDEEEKPVIVAVTEIGPANLVDVHAVELRDADNSTVLARWEFGQLEQQGDVLRAQLLMDNAATLVRSKTLFAYTQNTLGEYSSARTATGSKPEPAKPSLTAGNSVGQIIEVLLDQVPDVILETEIQVAAPTGDFSAPAQDVLLPGQPGKFSFVATQSGGWSFRARRRDILGWSPWSNEPQGQVPGETLIVSVQFFRATELDPSIGAAVNSQNLLPNSEFFLGGIAGQEGTHVGRYFLLVNAAGDGSEVDHTLATNEMLWKAGVNFGLSEPGFRSLVSNLGKLFNPGEPLTLSAALRYAGSIATSPAVRFSLRSASSPAYDQSGVIPAERIPGQYQWFSVTFVLPSDQAVPADLAAEVALVIGSGQSLAATLACDKVILNRGHRPAAFSLAPWDVVPLAWNAGAGAYDLPPTVLAAAPRASDPGNAGRLVGTGTEDLDPDFEDRYFRLTA